MRRSSVIANLGVLACAVALTVAGADVAVATPPMGGVEFKDFARAQMVEGTSVALKTGTGLAEGAYSIAPGGTTGWRQMPGIAFLAVNKGKMSLHRADGCSTTDYAAGKATFVSPGTYRIANTGSEALEIVGFFLNQPAGSTKPLTEGTTVAAPAKCGGFTAASLPASGVSVTNAKAATLVPGMFGYGANFAVEAGKDVLINFFDLYPGFRSGWISHLPAANIMSGGVLSYVMARDGKCDTSESYSTGQGFYHPAHRHFAYNDGKDHVLLTAIYFNLPHHTPAPVIGNTTDAIDFFQAPPADCPRMY